MHKISEIISKPVFSVYEGTLLGTVSNFVLNLKRKKIESFCFVDDESDFSYNCVPTKNIYSLKENLIVKNLSCLEIIENEPQNIMNQKALTIFGEELGKISDIFFDDNFNVISYETTNKIVLPAANLVNVGKDVVFFNVLNKKINISKMKPNEKIKISNLPEIKVSILTQDIPIISENYNQESFVYGKRIEGEKQLKSKTEIEFPKKIGATNLIGKLAKKTVVGLNGEVVVKTNQTITNLILEKAKKHGKLFELENSIL